jgi:hypothetical protein
MCKKSKWGIALLPFIKEAGIKIFDFPFFTFLPLPYHHSGVPGLIP